MITSMDSLNGNVKNTLLERCKSPVDVNGGIVSPNKRKDAGEEMPRCDSLQLVTYPKACNSTQSFALPLMPVPKVEKWCSNTSIVLTGTACRGGSGPPIGITDIGESKSAYYFCVALPGVKKDPGKFLFASSLCDSFSMPFSVLFCKLEGKFQCAFSRNTT